MKTLKFSVHIGAPREIVWNVLWNDESYKKWTSVFSEGSYAVSDWKEGSKILFLSPNGEGMNSMIARKIPNEFMSFRHMGMYNGGAGESPSESPDWAGSLENYYLHEEDGITQLRVELETTDETVKYFEGTFPLALKQVKELAEVPQHYKVF
jgi:hypothetical protein